MADAKPALTQEQIQQVTRQVVQRFRPKRVILFGSHAYGEPRQESDLDLLVVVPNPPSRREAWKLAHEITQPLPLQIVFMSPEEFEETKDVVGGLAYPAHNWGQVLYAEEP